MSNKNKHNNFHKYFLIIPISMLFGSLAQWPYGYFTLQRWVVTISSVILLIKAFDQNIDWAKIAFILIAILFNYYLRVIENVIAAQTKACSQ